MGERLKKYIMKMKMMIIHNFKMKWVLAVQSIKMTSARTNPFQPRVATYTLLHKCQEVHLKEYNY
jgi:hypothetical protein